MNVGRTRRRKEKESLEVIIWCFQKELEKMKFSQNFKCSRVSSGCAMADFLGFLFLLDTCFFVVLTQGKMESRDQRSLCSNSFGFVPADMQVLRESSLVVQHMAPTFRALHRTDGLA